jgi:FADH2 O2-dependent halogenase
LGIEVVERIGLRPALERAGPVVLRHSSLHVSDGTSVSLGLSRPMWGISRAVLDAVLLDAARAAGAHVIVPARCEGIVPGEWPSARVRHLTSNHVEVMRTMVVLLADGKSALLPGRAPPTQDLGVKAHFANLRGGSRDSIELFGGDGHYIGVAPIEGDRWNAAMSVPATKVARFGGDLEAVFASMLDENESLGDRFRGATRVSRWLASPLPRFAVSRRWPRNVTPLGNAAAALEPIGGEGMGLAMRSAELAAEELIAAEEMGRAADFAGLRRSFDRLWRIRHFGCRAAAVMISSPALATSLAPIVDGSPALQRLAMTLIGK